MNSDTFVLWLQGFLAACNGTLTVEQQALIEAKLAEVQMRGPFRG